MTVATSGRQSGIALAAALAGLLFGFDTAVISGVTGPITDVFSLDAAGTGVAVSAALVGTLVAALAAGLPGLKSEGSNGRA